VSSVSEVVEVDGFIELQQKIAIVKSNFSLSLSSVGEGQDPEFP
jgi:hypothetical protein